MRGGKYMIQQERKMLEDILNYKIPSIKKDVHFWMVRTQGGAFYDEFLTKNYVAFGWNYIDKSTNLNNELLPDEIKEQYNISQAKRAINKCNMFMNVIQPNDVILIPNKGLEEIIIAIAKEYYEEPEENGCTLEDEKGVLWKLKNVRGFLKEVKCPYKKRWKIDIVKTVKGNRLNYHLYKTLRNYNGIDDIDEHAAYILSLIFNTFIYDKNLYIVLNVNQEKDIGLSDLSGILYGSSAYFSHFLNSDNVSAKVNVCSKGDILMVLQGAFEHVQTFGPLYVKLFLTLFSGTYGIMKVKDLPDFLKEIFTIKDKCEQEKIETELKRAELESKQLDNEQKRLEIEKLRLANEISKQSINGLPTEEEIGMIVKSSDPLEISVNIMEENKKEAISSIVES